MAGIEELQQIYAKRGNDFLNKLFTEHVTVLEKLDGSYFSIEKSETGFIFHKKSGPITKIERTIMRFYEKAIEAIEAIPQDVYNTIPVGYRFVCDYFPNNVPNILSYDSIPGSGLVLSCIHVSAPNGSPSRIISDKKSLDTWATILGIQRPPFVFSGKLSNFQIHRIRLFLDTPYSELLNKFQTESFSEYVLGTLDPSIRSSILQSDIRNPIEGVIFKFDDSKITATVIDPVFQEKTKQKKLSDNRDREDAIMVYALTDFMEFFVGRMPLSNRKYKLTSKHLDERYLELICLCFNDFMQFKKKAYVDVDFKAPTFMRQREFQYNDTFVPNEATKALLAESSSLQDLFKIILAFFRKKKRKMPGMHSDVIAEQNRIVSHILGFIEIGINESLFTYDEYQKMYGASIYESYLEEAEEPEMLSDDSESTMRLIGTLQNMFGRVKEDKPKKKKLNEAIVLVGNFQPFHNGHVAMLESIQEQNKKMPIFLVQKVQESPSKNRPFNQSISEKILDAIVGTYGVLGYSQIKSSAGLSDILDEIQEQGYYPSKIVVSGHEGPNFKLDLEYTNRYGKILSEDQTVIVQRKGTKKLETRGRDVRKAISENSYKRYSELVPKELYGMFEMLRDSLHSED